jgi:hypothetical protein
MSWMSPDTLADTGPERRSFFRLSIGSRLALWFTLSAFVILATVIVVQYRIMLRGLEWDENQLLTDKVKMFESTLRTHGDNPEFLDHEVNLEGGAYWPDQHYVVYSRILDRPGRTAAATTGRDARSRSPWTKQGSAV